MSGQKISRRRWVEIAAGTIVGLIVGAALGYITASTTAPLITEKVTETAAGTTVTATATPTTTPKPESVKIRMQFAEPNPQTLAILEKMMRRYQSENPNVWIELETVPWGEQLTKQAADFAAGIEPDIMEGGEWPFRFLHKGLLAPMDDLINSLGGRTNFYESTLDCYSFEGKTYAIPYYESGPILWYRKDLLAQKGLKVPETWDELLAAARALTEDTDGDGKIDRWGIAVPYSRDKVTDIFLSLLVWGNNGKYFDKDLKPVLTSKENTEALAFMKELAKYSPPGSSEYAFAQEMNAIVTGRTAMTCYWSRVLGAIYSNNPDLKDKVGSVAWPSPPGGRHVTRASPSTLYMSARSKHIDECKKWLKFFFTSDEYIDLILTVPIHMIPSYKPAGGTEKYLSNTLIKDHPDLLRAQEAALEMGVTLARESADNPFNPYAGDFGGSLILEDVVQKCIIEGLSPEEALKWGQVQTEKLVEELKK